MKISIIFVPLLLPGWLVGQVDQASALVNNYPSREQTYYFTKKIWLGKKVWDFPQDESGLPYFNSRADAEGAEIRLIPIFSPSKQRIDGYDSTKNILDFLESDVNRRYVAIIRKNSKVVCIVEAWRNKKWGKIYYTIEEITAEKLKYNLYKALTDGSLIYYDNVVRLFCRVQNSMVYVHIGYNEESVPYFQIIGKGLEDLEDFKKLVQSRAER